MKSSTAGLFVLSGALAAVSTTAFSPMRQGTCSKDTSLYSSRRKFLETTTVAAGFLAPAAASAEPRPMYLTEPTDEFKENEAKAAEFKRKQLQTKREFLAALDKLSEEPNDADAMVSDLKEIRGLVAKTGGLPLGIKKEEMFKIIRSKKAKGFWPTPVEVA